MKYCHRAFDYIYFDHYNGNVFLCPWMDPKTSTVGNILKQDFEEIWRGKRAEEIRDTVRNGSFCQCRRVACPHLQNDDLPDIDMEPGDVRLFARNTPFEINLAFDFVCNQSCPTCRNDVFVPDSSYDETINCIVEKIQPYLNKAGRITASGHGDPFASPYMMKILENLRPDKDDLEIMLETNAVFFDENHWKRIEHLSKYNFSIIVTTNSFYEPIYNQISRAGNLSKLLDNLRFMKKLREEGALSRIANGIVVQEKNYWEIPEFIERSLQEFGFDSVVLKPVYNWGNLLEEEYWFKDVPNPLHPYHEEYKRIINLPIIKDNPRVYNFGGETMHEPKPMPGCGNMETVREVAYAKLFRIWLGIDDVGSVVSSYMKMKNFDSYMIYGAADVGRRLAKELSAHDEVRFAGFIDYYLDDCQIDEWPIFKPDCCDIKETDMIIVTPIHVFDAIKNTLENNGYTGAVVSIQDILKNAD